MPLQHRVMLGIESTGDVNLNYLSQHFCLVSSGSDECAREDGLVVVGEPTLISAHPRNR